LRRPAGPGVFVLDSQGDVRGRDIEPDCEEHSGPHHVLTALDGLAPGNRS
jgi:hypothetical protein